MTVSSPYLEASNDVKIDEQVLSNLLDSLIRLKKAGGRLKRDEIWVKPSSSFIDTAKDLHSVIFHLQALKRVKSALDTLTKSLEAIIITRQEEILPVSRHLGLLSLPTDVVVYIFRHLLDSYKDPFEGARIAIRDLSMVNRQFRSTLVGFTDAWTFLDLNYCSGEVLERHICRSKQAPLSVRFEYMPEMLQDIGLALAHRHRWKHLDVIFSEYNASEEGFIAELPSMNFPSIKSLCLFVDQDLDEESIHTICSKWAFPNAESMTMVEMIPDAGFKCEALTNFKYIGREEFNIPGVYHSFDRNIIDFLRPAINLRIMHLDISWIRDLVDPEEFFEVVLPNVTDFTITNCTTSRRPIQLDDFAQILRAIRMPNVENLSISIAFAEESFDLIDKHWVHLAFPDTHNLGSVTRLSFKVKWYPDPYETSTWFPADWLFHRFPTLKEFSIGTDCDDVDIRFCFCFSDPQLDLRNLKTLQFDGCDTYPQNLYTMLRVIAGAGASLDELKINSRIVIDLKELESIFTGADIQVTSSF